MSTSIRNSIYEMDEDELVAHLYWLNLQKRETKRLLKRKRKKIK